GGRGGSLGPPGRASRRGVARVERPPSLQDLIRSRQARGFVGRVEQLQLFEQSLSLPVVDPRRRFLFSVHGDGGIGKTFLLRQWQRSAQSRNYLTAYVDEAVFDVPAALRTVADDLARQGGHCRRLHEMVATYRQQRQEVDADPGAPPGVSSLLTRSAVRVGLRALEDIPFIGAFA